MGYMAAKHDDRVKSATYFVTMVDFADAGELSVFIDEEQLSALEERMNAKGYLEGRDMSAAFKMLRANDLIWSCVVNNYLLGRSPFSFDLLYWNADSTHMPAATHSFYAQHVSRELACQTGRDQPRRCADRLTQDQDPVLPVVDP
jgi:polyhydroxyalkanoate synthase